MCPGVQSEFFVMIVSTACRGCGRYRQCNVNVLSTDRSYGVARAVTMLLLMHSSSHIQAEPMVSKTDPTNQQPKEVLSEADGQTACLPSQTSAHSAYLHFLSCLHILEFSHLLN